MQYPLNSAGIREFDIPLPPLAEQQLSVVKEVESAVVASVARAGRLRQSVLKSAFEGRFAL